MFEIALQLVVFGVALAVVAVILHTAMRPRYQFLVQIKGDRLTVTKGKVHAVFLDEATEICQDFHITNGWIGGVKRGKTTALRFSNSIPPPCQQRLRNAWFCP